MRSLILSALLFSVAGCPGITRWETLTMVDEGTACLEGGGDDPAEVQVNADICLSSSCSRNAVGSCTASLTDGVITVESDFSWEEQINPSACTDDCGSLTATCDLGDLPAGDYVLRHGDTETDVTAPAEPCSAF